MKALKKLDLRKWRYYQRLIAITASKLKK